MFSETLHLKFKMIEDYKKQFYLVKYFTMTKIICDKIK